MIDMFNQALAFATAAHTGQVRKYTGEPYICHPIRVARTMAQVGYGHVVQTIALLHDVLEDCPQVTYEHMRSLFGSFVTDHVFTLTDVDHGHGNRSTRRLIDAKRLAAGDAIVHGIKCSDTLDNTPSILQYADKKFATLFLTEKRFLVPKLVHANPVLHRKAMEAIGLS